MITPSESGAAYPTPFLRGIVTLVHKRLTKGHSAPLLVQAKTLDGEMVEAVVKLRSRVHDQGLGSLAELICAFFARDLGLPTPGIALLEISEELEQGFRDHTDRLDVSRSLGLNFATQFISPTTVLPTGPEFPPALVDGAATLIAFDALVQNTDRHMQKPNCLIQGNDVIPIDHELASPFLHGTFMAPPWEHAGLSFLHNHVAFSRLQGQLPDFSSILRRASLITPDVVAGYFVAVPPVWGTGTQAVRLKDFLVELLPRIPEVFCLLEEKLR